MAEQHFQPSSVDTHCVSVLDQQWNERFSFTLHADGVTHPVERQGG